MHRTFDMTPVQLAHFEKSINDVTCHNGATVVIVTVLVVQQTQWDKGSILRDTSTGLPHVLTYIKLISGVSSFPKLEARGVNSYGELRKLTFNEGPLN